LQQAAAAHLSENALNLPIEGAGSVNGEVGMKGRGANVSDAGGAHGGFVLEADGVGRAASLQGVALETALEAELVRRVDVNAQLVEREQLRIVEREEAFDEDEWRGVEGFSLVGNADVGGEVV
jgi:hypothetical protein